ncbi:Protein nrde2, partial [Coemansia sp. RSA 2052]
EELVNSAFAPTTGRPKFRQRSKRAVAESQIEVYRRALRHNPESRMLVLGYFEQCSAILDDASLADEWELVLNSTSDPEVIMRYVAVLQTMSAQFSVAKVTAVYAKESGFTERAISVYQAVVEWYVLAPERLYLSPFSHRKRAFERFWDSGVPRIGVVGARGWSCYDNASSESATGHSRSDHSESPDPDSDQLAAWCRAEQRLAAQNALPASLSMAQLDEATIGSDDVDPNSLVVFEDVEPFIVDLPWSEDTAGLLLDRFMQFLGVVGPRIFVLS